MHYPPAADRPTAAVAPSADRPPSLCRSRSVSNQARMPESAAFPSSPPPLLLFPSSAPRSLSHSLGAPLARSAAWQLAEFVIYMAVCLSKLLSQSSHAASLSQPSLAHTLALPLRRLHYGVEIQAKRQLLHDDTLAAGRGRASRIACHP